MQILSNIKPKDSENLILVKFRWNLDVQQWLTKNCYPRYRIIVSPEAFSGNATVGFKDSEDAAVFRLKYGI